MISVEGSNAYASGDKGFLTSRYSKDFNTTNKITFGSWSEYGVYGKSAIDSGRGFASGATFGYATSPTSTKVTMNGERHNNINNIAKNLDDTSGPRICIFTTQTFVNANCSTTTGTAGAVGVGQKAVEQYRERTYDRFKGSSKSKDIDEDEYGAEISVFGRYDQEYDDALKPYIDNLKAATGEVDCPEAKRLAKKLKNECAEFARLSQDHIFDNLSHRALVHAFRKACLLYAANGMKWERSIDAFCRWSLFYDLYLKMTFWGDQIRHADDDIPLSKRGPQSLLDFLPETFTLDDAKRVRQQNGLEAGRAKKMISTWKSREYVIQISDFSFKKASRNGTTG